MFFSTAYVNYLKLTILQKTVLGAFAWGQPFSSQSVLLILQEEQIREHMKGSAQWLFSYSGTHLQALSYVSTFSSKPLSYLSINSRHVLLLKVSYKFQKEMKISLQVSSIWMALQAQPHPESLISQLQGQQMAEALDIQNQCLQSSDASARVTLLFLSFSCKRLSIITNVKCQVFIQTFPNNMSISISLLGLFLSKTLKQNKAQVSEQNL